MKRAMFACMCMRGGDDGLAVTSAIEKNGGGEAEGGGIGQGTSASFSNWASASFLSCRKGNRRVRK
jgi:hypothetical protein